jgi:hypothetical protein
MSNWDAARLACQVFRFSPNRCKSNLLRGRPIGVKGDVIQAFSERPASWKILLIGLDFARQESNVVFDGALDSGGATPPEVPRRPLRWSGVAVVTERLCSLEPP